MKKITLMLQFLVLCAAAVESTTAAVRDDEWRVQELHRARPFIRKHDFSPIDEAFAAKDINLLWHYYIGSYERNFQLFERITPERLKNAEERFKNDPKELARMKLAFERSQYASNYLRQIPGHAQLMVDLVEETLYRRAGGMSMRSTYMECLGRLGQDGSEECIVQLGRYLFDPRDPGFIPVDPASRPPSGTYNPQGVRNPVMFSATAAMGMVIKVRFAAFAKTLVDENSKPFKNMPVKDYGEKVRHWWLTSDEAAPYRRSLAALGLMLPPGYPPMKEFEGTKTTIAPPLINPPYPNDDALPPAPEKP